MELLGKIYVEWPRQEWLNSVCQLQSRLIPCERSNTMLLEVLHHGTTSRHLAGLRLAAVWGFFALTTLKWMGLQYLPALTVMNATLFSIYKKKHIISDCSSINTTLYFTTATYTSLLWFIHFFGLGKQEIVRTNTKITRLPVSDAWSPLETIFPQIPNTVCILTINIWVYNQLQLWLSYHIEICPI